MEEIRFTSDNINYIVDFVYKNNERTAAIFREVHDLFGNIYAEEVEFTPDLNLRMMIELNKTLISNQTTVKKELNTIQDKLFLVK